MSKKRVRLKMNTYTVVQRAVEDGIAYGITRLFKYFDGSGMSDEQMRERADALVDAVMNDLCEVVNFDEDV